MSHSEAYYHSDAGFYIGQTPQQTKPIRSVVRDVESWGNPIGFSATNMRYVTITKSRFYNNAIGIVPNALESEKFPPAEANVITDNDIFWNNFNVHAGAPFKPKKSGVVPLVPIGTGILLLGGRTNRVENNRVYGNYLVGVAAVEGILLDKTTEARALIGNQISGNVFGAGGEDLNGRDLAFDGNGTGNCWGPNTGVQNTLPADAGDRSRPARSPGPTRSARTRRPSSSASRAPTRSRAGSSTRTRPSPASRRWRSTRSEAGRRTRDRRRRARRGAGHGRRPQAADREDRRQLLPAGEADREARHHDQVALARRGRRRPRREAQVGPERREASSTPTRPPPATRSSAR